MQPKIEAGGLVRARPWAATAVRSTKVASVPALSPTTKLWSPAAEAEEARAGRRGQAHSRDLAEFLPVPEAPVVLGAPAGARPKPWNQEPLGWAWGSQQRGQYSLRSNAPVRGAFADPDVRRHAAAEKKSRRLPAVHLHGPKEPPARNEPADFGKPRRPRACRFRCRRNIALAGCARRHPTDPNWCSSSCPDRAHWARPWRGTRFDLRALERWQMLLHGWRGKLARQFAGAAGEPQNQDQEKMSRRYFPPAQ